MINPAMPKSVHITTPPLSYEEQVRRLRIPKKRLKELEAIADKAWADFQTQKEASRSRIGAEENPKSASAA